MLYLLIIIIVTFYMLNKLFPAKLGRYLYNTTMWLESKLYGFNKQTVAIDGIDICLLRNNNFDKEAIIMLHGFSSDKYVWLRFARYFNRQYHVIIPDLAGHGETEFSSSWNYDAISQVTRVKQLIERLNIEKFHIIGSSMGGLISAHFAHVYPHKVISVALVDPAGVYSPKPSLKDIMVNEGKNPFFVDNREQFNTFYAMTMEKPPWLPDCVLAAISEKYQTNIKRLEQIHNDFHHNNMLDDILSEINVPMLLMWGEQDKIIDISSLDIWKNRLPQAHVKTWQKIGHLPMLEIPQDSAKTYQNYLSNI